MQSKYHYIKPRTLIGLFVIVSIVTALGLSVHSVTLPNNSTQISNDSACGVGGPTPDLAALTHQFAVKYEYTIGNPTSAQVGQNTTMEIAFHWTKDALLNKYPTSIELSIELVSSDLEVVGSATQSTTLVTPVQDATLTWTVRPLKSGTINYTLNTNAKYIVDGVVNDPVIPASTAGYHDGNSFYPIYTDVLTGNFTATGAANQPPTANASATPTSGTTPLSVSFSSAGSTDPDGSISSYQWNFGDGQTASNANPSHTYTSAGNYTARLTVTDNNGATASDQITVSVTSGGGNGVVTLVKSVSATTAGPGDIITYTLQYANNSAVAVKNFTIVDPIPNGTKYVSGSASGAGIYISQSNEVWWLRGTVNPGGLGTMTFQVQIQ